MLPTFVIVVSLVVDATSQSTSSHIPILPCFSLSHTFYFSLFSFISFIHSHHPFIVQLSSSTMATTNTTYHHSTSFISIPMSFFSTHHFLISHGNVPLLMATPLFTTSLLPQLQIHCHIIIIILTPSQ